MIRLFSDLNSNSQDFCWVKSYILHHGFTSKFVVIRRDTTFRKVRWSWCPLLSFCTRYGSEIREHRRWDWVEHQIFSSHNLLAIWKISFSFSPSLSPFFFKHLYRNVWIYFWISLFQSPFFVCVCFERSHWKFGVQDNFATWVCSEVFALWLFGNQDHEKNHRVRLSKLHRKSLTQAFSICFSKVSYLNFAKLERVHEAVATQVCHEDVLLWCFSCYY